MAKHTVSSTGGFVPGSTNARAVRNPASESRAEPTKAAATDSPPPTPSAGEAAPTSTAAATDTGAAPKSAKRKRKVGKHKS